MRTNIVLDESLLREAFECSGARTKRELIHLALQEFVRNRRCRNLLELRGKIRFAEGYDHKSLREGR